MLCWEAVPDGYWECCNDEFSGVVALTRDRAGWRARIVGRSTTQVAPQLYHTMQDAKTWVEQQLATFRRSAPDEPRSRS